MNSGQKCFPAILRGINGRLNKNGWIYVVGRSVEEEVGDPFAPGYGFGGGGDGDVAEG